MRHRTAALVLVGLLLAGCAAGRGSTSPEGSSVPSGTVSASASPAPSVDPTGCANPPRIEDLVLQTDNLGCYGGDEITVDAFVGGIGAIDCAPSLQPEWFHCFAWVGLAPMPATSHYPTTLAVARPDQLLAPTGPGGLPLFATIHPDSGIVAADLLNRWLRITGHFDDPAAQNCHYTEGSGLEDPAGSIVLGCRSLFVITAAALPPSGLGGASS